MKTKPQKSPSRSRRQLFLASVLTLMLGPLAPAGAVPLSPEALQQIFSDLLGIGGRGGPSANPTIALQGRLGAESLQDVNQRLSLGAFDDVIERARAVLEQNPTSGLAYEVIGTAEFMRDRRASAIEALRAATEVESGQSGPWTKLGIIQMEEGDVARAGDSLRQAIEINAADRFAHQRLGLLYEYEGDIANAIYHFEQGLVGTDASYLGVATNLGNLYNRLNRPQQTIRTLEPRVRADTPVPEAHLVLATAYLLEDRFGDAFASYDRASQLNPELDEARIGMAMAERGAGQADEALGMIDEILTERPDWRVAHAERAETLLVLGRFDAANASFERYIALGGDPSYGQKRTAAHHLEREEFEAAKNVYAALVAAGRGDPDAYAKLSELELAAGFPNEGERALRDGIRQHPDSVYLKLRLGTYLGTLQRYDEAVVALEETRRLAPNDPTVLRSLSLAQTRTGDRAAAAETAGRLYRAVPRSDMAAFYAARLRANGQDAEAAAVYREVLSTDPEDVLALNNLADLLADGGELEEAEQLARRANAAMADNPILMDTLAWVQHRQGAHAAALATLDRAVAMAPQTAVIHYHRGLALAGLGRNAEARRALREAMDLAPNAEWAADAEQRMQAL